MSKEGRCKGNSTSQPIASQFTTAVPLLHQWEPDLNKSKSKHAEELQQSCVDPRISCDLGYFHPTFALFTSNWSDCRNLGCCSIWSWKLNFIASLRLPLFISSWENACFVFPRQREDRSISFLSCCEDSSLFLKATAAKKFNKENDSPCQLPQGPYV